MIYHPVHTDPTVLLKKCGFIDANRGMQLTRASMIQLGYMHDHEHKAIDRLHANGMFYGYIDLHADKVINESTHEGQKSHLLVRDCVERLRAADVPTLLPRPSTVLFWLYRKFHQYGL